MNQIIKILIFLTIFLMLELSANIGTVVALKGDGEILRNTKRIPLSLSLLVEKNDLIITKDNSKVQIMFTDETIITLGKNSNVEINEFLFKEKTDSNSKLDFKFLKGIFKIITGEIGKINPDGFKITTKTANIGIRGTQINLELTDSREFIKCAEGAIDITLLSTGETQLLKSGESISINISTSNKKKDGSLSNSLISSSKIDTKYDSWIKENNSIRKAVEDKFKEGHIQDYETTYLNGTIVERNDGTVSFDTSNATFEMSIDFGKERDDNPVTVSNFKIMTNSQNTVKNVVGNINENNEIELSYTTNSLGKQDVINTMKFKNNDLDVEGKDLEFKTGAQDEPVTIHEIQLEAK